MFTVLNEICYSFHWINLNMDWVSPLIQVLNIEFIFTTCRDANLLRKKKYFWGWKKVFCLEKQYFSFCFHRSVHKVIFGKKSILRHFAQNHKYLQLEKVLNTAKKEQLASLYMYFQKVIIEGLHVYTAFKFWIHLYTLSELILKHKDSFGKSENLSKIFFAEILVFDHDYEGKSSSSKVMVCSESLLFF